VAVSFKIAYLTEFNERVQNAQSVLLDVTEKVLIVFGKMWHTCAHCACTP